ncbi:MAG: hypothetical protein P8Y70_14330 [Candidatus Lokiarchaeota archaeon]
MLYNLLVLNSTTGLNIVTVKLSEKGIDEESGFLMSGIVKAIQSFLQELKFGEIRTFQTHEKKVIVYQKDHILTALVADESESEGLYLPKIKYITEIFNNAYDWENWGGEIDIFNKEIESVLTILNCDDEDLIKHFSSALKKMINSFTEIYGYKILISNKLKEEVIVNMDNYELKSLFESEFFKSIMDNYKTLKKDILNFLGTSSFLNSYVNYKKFSLFFMEFIQEISIILLLQGNLDPLSDIAKFENKIKELTGF